MPVRRRCSWPRRMVQDVIGASLDSGFIATGPAAQENPWGKDSEVFLGIRGKRLSELSWYTLKDFQGICAAHKASGMDQQLLLQHAKLSS